jgi:hypothetical protein
MDVVLIRAGLVENVITADSIERAQEVLPDFDEYLEREEGSTVGAGWAWDGQTFTPPSPVQRERQSMTKYQFLLRMPAGKRIAIRAAAKTDPIIEDAMMMLDLAEEVFADDPMTIQLVGYLQLEGYLTEQEAGAMLV